MLRSPGREDDGAAKTDRREQRGRKSASSAAIAWVVWTFSLHARVSGTFRHRSSIRRLQRTRGVVVVIHVFRDLRFREFDRVLHHEPGDAFVADRDRQ